MTSQNKKLNDIETFTVKLSLSKQHISRFVKKERSSLKMRVISIVFLIQETKKCFLHLLNHSRVICFVRNPRNSILACLSQLSIYLYIVYEMIITKMKLFPWIETFHLTENECFTFITINGSIFIIVKILKNRWIFWWALYEVKIKLDALHTIFNHIHI